MIFFASLCLCESLFFHFPFPSLWLVSSPTNDMIVLGTMTTPTRGEYLSQEVLASARMTSVFWNEEIPAFAGIEMRNRTINDVWRALLLKGNIAISGRPYNTSDSGLRAGISFHLHHSIVIAANAATSYLKAEYK